MDLKVFLVILNKAHRDPNIFLVIKEKNSLDPKNILVPQKINTQEPENIFSVNRRKHPGPRKIFSDRRNVNPELPEIITKPATGPKIPAQPGSGQRCNADLCTPYQIPGSQPGVKEQPAQDTATPRGKPRPERHLIKALVRPWPPQEAVSDNRYYVNY